MKSNLQIAESIIDIDKRHNAGGLMPIRTYKGVIDGHKLSRSSTWWGIYKHKIENRKGSNSTLINGRSGRGWTDEEATGAYLDESLQQYRRRIKSNKTTNIDQANRLTDRFIYGPVRC